jgi:exonuclease III
MLKYIKNVDPDVLCLQEFVQHNVPGVFSNTADLKKLGYIYVSNPNEVVHYHNNGMIITSSAIFSKVPIIDSAKVLLGDTSYPEYLTSADIMFEQKKLRLFTTHFKSINLFAGPANDKNRVVFYGDSDFVYTSTKFEKLKAFGQAHAREALIAKEAMENSPFPIVIGLDMNSVPTSYPYFKMSSGLQDAFTVKGWGLGTTMSNLPKTLRIDFLLVDKRLEITNYHKDEVVLSDHFPQFIDVKWKK